MPFLLGIWRVEERQSVGEGPRAKPPQKPAVDLGGPGGARLGLLPPPVCRSTWLCEALPQNVRKAVGWRSPRPSRTLEEVGPLGLSTGVKEDGVNSVGSSASERPGLSPSPRT